MDKSAIPDPHELDVQGHRGCRGLMPENTIPAFLHAVQLGVNTLEMDVVISQDKQVVVSHEPVFHPDLCHLEPSMQETRLYHLSYAEICRVDCGSKGNPKFPRQQKLAACKPLLREVIREVESYLRAHGLPPIQYNIETKCTPSGDGILHPGPHEFTGLLFEVLEESQVRDRCFIQSFDMRTLRYARQMHPGWRTAILVSNDVNPETVIQELGFKPNRYSPHFKTLTRSRVGCLHDLGMKVLPWTVNRPEDMISMIRMKVDGIITDYPDQLLHLLGRR